MSVVDRRSLLGSIRAIWLPLCRCIILRRGGLVVGSGLFLGCDRAFSLRFRRLRLVCEI